MSCSASERCKVQQHTMGKPVTMKIPRMGVYSGLSGPTTPKIGFLALYSNKEPTCRQRPGGWAHHGVQCRGRQESSTTTPHRCDADESGEEEVHAKRQVLGRACLQFSFTLPPHPRRILLDNRARARGSRRCSLIPGLAARGATGELPQPRLSSGASS